MSSFKFDWSALPKELKRMIFKYNRLSTNHNLELKRKDWIKQGLHKDLLNNNRIKRMESSLSENDKTSDFYLIRLDKLKKLTQTGRRLLPALSGILNFK